MDNDLIINAVNGDTKAVFLTHAQGFNGLTDQLLNFLSDKNIHLIEDVCESHGASHNGQRVGSFGLMSNFSFIMRTTCPQLKVEWFALMTMKFMKN